jgi:hypothetical protein
LPVAQSHNRQMNGVCPLLIQFRPQENAALVLPLRAPLLVAPLDRLLARRGSGAAQWQGAAGASNGSGGLSGAVTSTTVSSLAFINLGAAHNQRVRVAPAFARHLHVLLLRCWLHRRLRLCALCATAAAAAVAVAVRQVPLMGVGAWSTVLLPPRPPQPLRVCIHQQLRAADTVYRLVAP